MLILVWLVPSTLEVEIHCIPSYGLFAKNNMEGNAIMTTRYQCTKNLVGLLYMIVVGGSFSTIIVRSLFCVLLPLGLITAATLFFSALLWAAQAYVRNIGG